MEIKIRGVDPMAVKKIDEWARDKGISRQVYLKELLESMTVMDIHSNTFGRLEKQLEVNTMFLEKTSDTLDELVGIMKELIIDE